MKRTEADLLKYRNFGKKSLAEIQGILKEMGLALGMAAHAGKKETEVKWRRSLRNKVPREIRRISGIKSPKSSRFQGKRKLHGWICPDSCKKI